MSDLMEHTNQGPDPPEEESEESPPKEQPLPEARGNHGETDLDQSDLQEQASPVPTKEGKKPKKKSTLKALTRFLIKLSLVALFIWLALTFVFGVFRMEGNNMYPMLKDGDLCVTYKLEEYHSQDVVAYRVDGQLHFGRIIARSGDVVDGDAQGLRLNGLQPAEEIFYPTQILDTDLDLPITLGDGEFVVLNDYRSDLSDSRTYGVITEDALEGKVIFIFRRRSF